MSSSPSSSSESEISDYQYPRGSSKKIGKKHLFVCSYCSKEFPRSEHMLRHQRKHTGEKPFICSQPNCGKRFSRFDNMMQHFRAHSQDHPRRKRLGKEGIFKGMVTEEGMFHHILFPGVNHHHSHSTTSVTSEQPKWEIKDESFHQPKYLNHDDDGDDNNEDDILEEYEVEKGFVSSSSESDECSDCEQSPSTETNSSPSPLAVCPKSPISKAAKRTTNLENTEELKQKSFEEASLLQNLQSTLPSYKTILTSFSSTSTLTPIPNPTSYSLIPSSSSSFNGDQRFLQLPPPFSSKTFSDKAYSAALSLASLSHFDQQMLKSFRGPL